MSDGRFKWSYDAFSGLYSCRQCGHGVRLDYQRSIDNMACENCAKAAQAAMDLPTERKITSLRPETLQPESVLAMLLEDAKKIESIVIVTKDKAGNHQIHCACRISDLPFAAFVIHEHFSDVRTGRTPEHHDATKEPK